MSMVEDEALAVYAAAKEQQAAVALAIEAMNKASKDISGRYADFSAALDRIEKVPRTALEPLKTALETTIEVGLDKHLTSKTKALDGALTKMEERVEAVKDRGILLPIFASLAAGFIGAAFAIGAQIWVVPLFVKPAPVAAAADNIGLPMTAEAPVRKKKKQP